MAYFKRAEFWHRTRYDMEQQSCDDRQTHERLDFNLYFRHDTTEEGPAGE